MKDDRTEEQKYAAWVRAITITHKKGWRHVVGWVFESPSGSRHDLSASDLEKLDLIEDKQLSLV